MFLITDGKLGLYIILLYACPRDRSESPVRVTNHIYSILVDLLMFSILSLHFSYAQAFHVSVMITACFFVLAHVPCMCLTNISRMFSKEWQNFLSAASFRNPLKLLLVGDAMLFHQRRAVGTSPDVLDQHFCANSYLLHGGGFPFAILQADLPDIDLKRKKPHGKMHHPDAHQSIRIGCFENHTGKQCVKSRIALREQRAFTIPPRKEIYLPNGFSHKANLSVTVKKLVKISSLFSWSPIS